MSSVASSRTYVKKREFYSWFFPFALLAMTGSAIVYFHHLFNGNTRWLVLICLFIYFILKMNFIRFFDASLLFVILLYSSWCLMTSFWSDIPILSFMKSSMLLICVFTLVRAGIEWIKVSPWENTLDYLWMLTFACLLAAFLGKYSLAAQYAYTSGDSVTHQFQGLVAGSNMMGSLLCMSFPLLIWNTYRGWADKKKGLFWLFLTTSSFYFLILTMARASMLAALSTLGVFLLSLNLGKKAVLLIFGTMIILTVVTVKPDVISIFSNSARIYIFKYQNAQTNLFQTRKIPWEQSMEGARQGNMLGLGYGVTWGYSDYSLDFGLRSNMYGREKGNSQLAILEETGMVGFVFYLAFIVLITAKLISLFSKAIHKDQRVLIGIITGIFFGMIIQSVFEDWWGSPGSPESIYFWILIGVIRGLEIKLKKKRVAYAAPRIEA